MQAWVTEKAKCAASSRASRGLYINYSIHVSADPRNFVCCAMRILHKELQYGLHSLEKQYVVGL